MNKKIPIILIIVLTLIIGGFFLYMRNYSRIAPNETGLSPDECGAKGGEVINILDDKRADDLVFRRDHKPEFCNDLSAYLGDVIGLSCPCICCEKRSFTEQQAILQIKEKYMQFSDFPYDGLPPKSIIAEKYQDDWYVAFIQEGSGRPIIEARCFIVKPNGDVIENGKFIPKLDNNKELDFSVKKCEYSK